MSRHTSLRALAAAIGFAGVAGSCSPYNNDVAGPSAAKGEIFDRYVAIGNSITAGYQSSGITDATQRQSYAFLLAQTMGTRYAYASFTSPGCPPPVVNFQTQARPTGTTGTTCAFRSAASATDMLNNVAVPGATSLDPTSTSTSASSALTTFILGGKTQVQRALELKPTFATIWIGHNDYLSYVFDGRTASLAGMTSVATFQTNYDAMLSQLTTGAPGLNGVLMALLTSAPAFFPATTFATAGFKATFDAVACGGTPNSCAATGGATLLDASCTSAPNNASLVNTFLAHNIRSGAHPSIIACTPGGAAGTFPAPIGDVFILDPGEQTTVNTRVAAYNAHIQVKATELKWAYYDPNPAMAVLRTANTVIRGTPNYLSATAAFGTGYSLDGLHPGAGVHIEFANGLIAAINAKYGTALPTIQ